MKKNNLESAMLGILAIVGGIAYILKDIIIYIFYGIFTAIILWLTYHVVLAFYYALIALRDYEKKTSIFKNTFNKLKKYILSIYSKWYFQSKEFQQTKEYMCICAIDILMINDNALEFMMTPHQYLYIDEQDEAIKDSQNKINDFLLQKQDIFLTKLQKEQSLNSIDHKIPKIIKKYYHQTLEDKLGFYKTTLDELVSAYSLFYFQSKEFMSLKEQIATYIQNCNKLNEHINELERANLNASQRDYGNVVSIDTSLYNYNRPYYFLNNDKNTYYTTNLNLYRNAEIQPFKYFCKYFHIEKNKTTLADFEDTLNAFYTIEEGKSLLESEKNRILNNMGSEIPSIIKVYARKELEHQLGFQEVGFNQLSYPTFTFEYGSAGGYKSEYFELLFDEIGLERFIAYLADEIKYMQSIKYQRALMSKNLREYIKKRDNYTCKYCKNSIYNEPNLLLEIDHITPLSKGGLSIEENLQTLCWRCNRNKGAKIIDK